MSTADDTYVHADHCHLLLVHAASHANIWMFNPSPKVVCWRLLEIIVETGSGYSTSKCYEDVIDEVV